MSQHMEALKKGNVIRVEMAETKRRVKSGDLDPVKVIQECELPLKVLDFLTAIPSVGTVKARNILKATNLSERNSFGGERRDGRFPITDEQRIRLAEHVGWRVAGLAQFRAAA